MTQQPGELAFARLIDEAAEAVEKSYDGVTIEPAAKRVLLARVNEHRVAITAQIKSGLTAETFRDAARAQLTESIRASQELTHRERLEAKMSASKSGLYAVIASIGVVVASVVGFAALRDQSEFHWMLSLQLSALLSLL